MMGGVVIVCPGSGGGGVLCCCCAVCACQGLLAAQFVLVGSWGSETSNAGIRRQDKTRGVADRAGKSVRGTEEKESSSSGEEPNKDRETSELYGSLR